MAVFMKLWEADVMCRLLFFVLEYLFLFLNSWVNLASVNTSYDE